MPRPARSKYRAIPREADVQRCILDYLAAEKIWHMRLNTAAFAIPASGNQKRRYVHAGKPGMADIMAVRRYCGKCGFSYPCPGGERESELRSWQRTIWIEVKAPIGKQSPEQKAFQAEVEAQGMTYILARSLEDVKEALHG